MRKRTVIIIISIIIAIIVAAGLGVLIWWLVTDTNDFTVIHFADNLKISGLNLDFLSFAYGIDNFEVQAALNFRELTELKTLEGDGIGDVQQTAAFTRIRNRGDMFWWFYPTTGNISYVAASRPTILWLDGITGVPPSLLANFGMFGPYDFNLNRRNDSWVDQYNLLFVDAPLGTGFSTATNANQIPGDLDENVDHLQFVLESFYTVHEEYSASPLYIFGQGHGAQLAVSLAIRLSGLTIEGFPQYNLRSVIIANGIISPALAFTKLGFYLEELAYIDGNGRSAIETLSDEVNALVNDDKLEEAFDKFMSLGEFVNENAGAVAVNLGHIVEKLTRDSIRDFGAKQYLNDILRSDGPSFMDSTVAPALGISTSSYDNQRKAALQAFKSTFMLPITDKVEYLLQNTNLTIIIYNGNLDAVSNTPGQLLWVDNLVWPGQTEFRNSPRETLVVNSLVEGYFRETQRLKFYWMNAAGHSVPLDSPVAMRRVLQRIIEN